MNINNKTYLVAVIIILTIITVLNITSCDTTEPEKVRSPRDYTWTADTVYNPQNPQTLMTSVWGSSENDIYMCGHSSGSPGNLWHYDGTQWKVIDLFKEIGYGAQLTGVHGTSAQNVWVVGYKEDYKKIPTPYLIKYNGLKWEKYEIEVNFAINNVFVKDRNDVWVCGSDGIVCHFNGSNWEVDTLSVNVPEGAQYNLYSISSTDNETYVYGNLVEDNGIKVTFYIFVKDNNSWNILDSFMTDNSNNTLKWGYSKIYTSATGKLYSIGGGLWERIHSGWTSLISYNSDFKGFYEKGENNIIIVGSHSEQYHFNGSNWAALKLNHDGIVHFSEVWMTDKSVTIIGLLLDEYPQKTIVFTGR